MLHAEISLHRWVLQEHGGAEWYCQLHIHSKLLIKSCLLFNSSSTAKQLFFATVSILCFVFIRYRTWPWASSPCPNSTLSIRHQPSYSSTTGSGLQERLSSTNQAGPMGSGLLPWNHFMLWQPLPQHSVIEAPAPKELIWCHAILLAAFHYFAKRNSRWAQGREGEGATWMGLTTEQMTVTN